MTSPKISIALATYNGGRFVREQLESFSSQSLLPDELVACDDGSTDDTMEILEGFRAEAPFPVRIHRNHSNLGYVRNFEKALSLCEGDVIFLSDQDDMWFESKIERVIAEFDDNPEIMVVLNDQVIADAQMQPSRVTKLMNIRRSGLPDYRFVTGCCSAHRKAWHSIALPIPDAGCSHDRWINELAHRLGVARIVPVPLQLYRRHPSNVSHSSISSAETGGRRNRSAAIPNPAWLELVSARLSERHETLARLGLASSAERVIADIDDSLRVRRQRQHIWSLPRRRRLRLVANLWRSGAYRHFFGWRSALGDIVKARSRN